MKKGTGITFMIFLFLWIFAGISRAGFYAAWIQLAIFILLTTYYIFSLKLNKEEIFYQDAKEGVKKIIYNNLYITSFFSLGYCALGKQIYVGAIIAFLVGICFIPKEKKIRLKYGLL